MSDGLTWLLKASMVLKWQRLLLEGDSQGLEPVEPSELGLGELWPSSRQNHPGSSGDLRDAPSQLV